MSRSSKKKSKKTGGAEAFEAYFSSVYADRWASIKTALHAEDLKVARRNRFFSDESELQKLLSEPGLGEPFQDESLQDCYEVTEDFDLSSFTTPMLPFYRMDPASILAAKALDVQTGEMVLDMCAAPGGKTLVLAEALNGTGTLVANELSPKRRFRLMSVIKRYVPAEIRKTIKITNKDAARFGMMKKRFHRILLDAPCSGERGVLQKQSDLASWKEKRTKSFAIKQYSLLSSAFLCLEPGGRIVYSTCSISPHENDGVIAKLHKRHAGRFKILPQDYGRGKATDYGWHFLPDDQGWGPIYIAVIEKNFEVGGPEAELKD